MVKAKTDGSLAQSARPNRGPAVEDELVPWPRENLPKGAGPWRRTMLTAGKCVVGHGTAVVESTMPMRHRTRVQLGWIRLADPQLPLAPLQAILALFRATWTPLQTRWRLFQTTQGTTLVGERWRVLAPPRAKVTPLQTIWRLFQARMMPFQARWRLSQTTVIAPLLAT